MSTTCSGCGSKIQSINYMECTVCRQTFDLACVNITEPNFAKLSQDYKDTWTCPTCFCSRPKGDNTHTPVRGSNLNDTFTSSGAHVNNLARGSRYAQQVATTDDSDSQILSEIRQLRIDLTNQNTDLGTKLVALSATFEQKMSEFEKNLQAKDDEILDLRESLQQMQARMNYQEQCSMKNELEISGIPEAENENLYHIARVTAKKIGVDLIESDLDEVTRVGSRRPASALGEKPRLIVVRLTRRAMQAEITKAAKSRRNQTTADIVPGSSNALYINERLTKTNRLLFREARLRCREHGFRYCWVRDGAIYVRRADKAPAVHIRSVEDLELRVGLPTANTSAK